ncbi:MAG: DNA polymerase Y family protein [Hyphomicrobiales bacterium]|nr:DNA polymerase Y family protein [Hyphomicrobiales bacterium]MDE2372940.1 DNA polymerase Y family protein [Hyphomicrobiales bacterium]
MSRIVSVWLPRWPILRMLAAQAKHPSSEPVDPHAPFVLTLTASGGPRLAALNAAAEAAGLTLGQPLADARAKAGFLQARESNPAADAAALRRLALWATRYTPTASPWHADNGADGFFLDIEGAAHLFGGEEKLLADLAARLHENFGLPARLAVAGTSGAAWALSRFHAEPCIALASGGEAAALSPLPVEALRLPPDTCATLRRLGFKTVGALLDKPRAPFAARFPAELLRRVDQALGRLDEPLVPVVPPPVYHVLRYLLEPIITQQAVLALARRLMNTLVHVLARDDVGARALRLSLYHVDGAVETVDVGLTLPTRDVAHVARLLDLKLETLAAMQEAGFGFEAIGLAVTRAEPVPARQLKLDVGRHPEVRAQRASKEDGRSVLSSFEGHLRWSPQDDDNVERCAALIDTLRGRLGPHSVRQFVPVASHNPERAEILPPINGEMSASWPEPEQPRPLLILPRAERAEVTALVPDGPPRRFCWRGVTYDVTGAEGPERIGAEWWRRNDGHRTPEPTRDYYLVEDSGGRRFWLFREGLYGRETAPARWFVHGLFA